MDIKTLRNALLIAGIPLLIVGCGGEAPDAGATPDSLPNTLPDTLKVKRLSKTYVITGIGLSDTKKVAIINGVAITSRKEIDPGVVLKDVQPTYAVILHGNTEHLLRPENIQTKLDKEKR
ncbi:MAG: hypothetical protein KAU94_05315 [Verrucomicrobia bacterium]|nr:hypothetical protein [Verrucomicrobiota bacterium]